MPLEDGLPDIPLEGGTVNTTTTQHKTVPSSSAKLPPSQQYTSTIDDSKLVTVTSSISSTPSTTTTSSPVYSPISSPRSPSSSSMDGISTLHHKRSRGSISSHSGSGSDTDDDERATKRHQSDSDVDSVASDETRTHEPIVTIKYGEHAIRVLTIEDGTRVVVAKDFLLLTGISKENCARTTKNLIEGKDKRMMHVPSSYCMNKGQQAVVLTASGLSQLLVTSRRLKQSAALQAWIKQTLMPALQGHATTATSTNNTTTEHVHMQSQSQAHNKTNTNTKSKNGRTIVKAKRSVGKSPSASPVIKAAPAPLALSPTTSSFSPFIRSPSSSSSSASSSPIRPTFSRLSSSDSESTMSDASTSSSTPSSPASSSSGMQELSAAADMMLITPNPMPLAKPLPMHFPMSMSMSMPFVPTFSRMHPTFPYRTPLMPLPTMAGMGIRPTFTAGKIWAAGA